MPDPAPPDDTADDTADALVQSQALAAALGALTWEVDGDPGLEAEPEPQPAVAPKPVAVPKPPVRAATVEPTATLEPEQILEAMLFVGGPPLNPDAVAQVIRGYTPERVRDAIDALNRRYEAQNRPYAVVPRDGGYVLAVGPAFHGVRERLFGGPREARLTQPALDVLSLIAYRQPVARADLDALRGADSTAAVRHLVRLGLIAVARRGDADAGYGTTPRFLELFNLTGLDDLPRLAE